MEHPDTDAHIANCPDCQLRASLAALDVDLEAVWIHVEGEVWAPRVSGIERLLAGVLQSPALARTLLATPSLVLSWIFASVAVLAIGVIATQSSGEPWFALLAPALAGISVGYAYGPGVDPAFELSQTMAVSQRMVLLVRVLAVFGLNALLGLIAMLVVADVTGLTLAWLLPMTMVAALALALSTLTRSASIGVVGALAVWGMLVLGAAYGADDLMAAVERPALLPLYLLVAVACGGLTLYATSDQRFGGRQWR